MRVVEEGYIKRTVAQLNKAAAGYGDYSALYKSIDSFETEPLQDLSFKSDLAYFDDVAFILNVITSIIAHPHISNKTEDIVIRTEIASTVTPETFNSTMRDFELKV